MTRLREQVVRHCSTNLVMPNTAYHERVPVLIGTNISGLCAEGADGGDEFSVVWRLALQSMVTPDSR